MKVALIWLLISWLNLIAPPYSLLPLIKVKPVIFNPLDDITLKIWLVFWPSNITSPSLNFTRLRFLLIVKPTLPVPVYVPGANIIVSPSWAQLIASCNVLKSNLLGLLWVILPFTDKGSKGFTTGFITKGLFFPNFISKELFSFLVLSKVLFFSNDL